MHHARVRTNGIELHVASAGPASGPLLILLHGFPETWESWRGQIDALAGLGWRVWAPDMRGYGESDRPDGIASYGGERLAADVAGLIDAAGCERAVVMGHDWGGVVAWQVGLRHPERVARLIVLNAPHPAAMRERVRTDARQRRRSWYVLAFQIPWLPELMLRITGWRPLTRALVASRRPGTFDAALLARYREAWSRPGAMRAMIGYYRAALRSRSTAAPSDRVRAPVLIIWGTEDRFLVRELATDSARWCDAARVEYVEGATHWVQHGEAARVNALVAAFLEQDE